MKKLFVVAFLLGASLFVMAASTPVRSGKEQVLIGCHGSGFPTISCTPGTKVTYHQPGVITGHGTDVKMDQGWISVEITTCEEPGEAQIEVCEYEADLK